MRSPLSVEKFFKKNLGLGNNQRNRNFLHTRLWSTHESLISTRFFVRVGYSADAQHAFPRGGRWGQGPEGLITPWARE